MNFLKTLLDSLLILLILILGFLDFTHNIGINEFVGFVEMILGTDKRLHFLTGVIITLFIFRLLYRLYDFKYLTTLNLSVVIAVLVLLVDEFSQLLFPTRTFGFDDVFAGGLGVLSMFLILFFYQLSLKNEVHGVIQNTAQY